MPNDEFVLTYAKQRNVVSCNPRVTGSCSRGYCQVCPNSAGYCVKPTNAASGSEPVLVKRPPVDHPTYCPVKRSTTVGHLIRIDTWPTTTVGSYTGFVRITTGSPQVFEKTNLAKTIFCCEKFMKYHMINTM